jgi:4-hydroxyproline epimerase
MSRVERIDVIDSHTAGEPTRVIVRGGPDLGQGPLAERVVRFRNHFDHFRSAVVNEPRGSDVLVGALLCPPAGPACVAGVIFFNNVGYIGMCGHGTIGLVVTLAHLGRIQPGTHRIDTPVGSVGVRWDGGSSVTVQNVPGYRSARQVSVRVEGHGEVVGDVAWGGNWFFLVENHGQELSLANVEHLTAFTWAIRRALVRQGIRGADGGEIDHIELFGPPRAPGADGRSFVLCPGGAYDRSPCGTGTSAKLACLIADGKLKPGQLWRQESILGTVFEGSATLDGSTGRVLPSIRGSAFVTAETTLLLQEDDPLRTGFCSEQNRKS